MAQQGRMDVSTVHVHYCVIAFLDPASSLHLRALEIHIF